MSKKNNSGDVFDHIDELCNGSGIQPEQVGDIMDFVEPEEYLMRQAFEKTVQYKNAHSKQQSEERYFLFSIGYKAATTKEQTEAILINDIAENEENNVIGNTDPGLKRTYNISTGLGDEISNNRTDHSRGLQSEDEKILYIYWAICKKHPMRAISRNSFIIGYKSRQPEIELELKTAEEIGFNKGYKRSQQDIEADK